MKRLSALVLIGVLALAAIALGGVPTAEAHDSGTATAAAPIGPLPPILIPAVQT